MAGCDHKTVIRPSDRSLAQQRVQDELAVFIGEVSILNIIVLAIVPEGVGGPGSAFEVGAINQVEICAGLFLVPSQ